MSVEQTDDVSQSGEAPHVRTTMTGESRDAEIAVSPPKRRRRTLTTTLAFAFLLAVLVGVAMYAYAKPGEGLGALLGQATVPLFVLALLAWRAHVRWDVGLVVVALFLIWMNRNEILETYDARRLLSEIGSASSPTDYLKGLQSSKSRFAEQIRAVLASANEANDKVSAVFAELNDPSLTNALTPANITDPDKVRRSQQTAKANATLARSAMQRIDGVLADELEQDQKIASEQSRGTAAGMIDGVKKRQAVYRNFYQRQTDVLAAWFDELGAMLSFLDSPGRAGCCK